MSETVKKGVIGVKRMGVILWCVTAICYLSYLATTSTEVPTSVIVTAMTWIAALGGVDKWKQVMDAR